VLERGQVGQTYLVGARAERTNLQIVAAICGALDQMSPATAPHARRVSHVPDRPGHDRRYAIDPSRVETQLGWRPTWTLEDGLAATVRWYAEHGDWWQPMLAAGALARRGQGR